MVLKIICLKVRRDRSNSFSKLASTSSALTYAHLSTPPLNTSHILNAQSIQVAIRSSLAHIRHSRIAPSAINAPPPGFIPPSLGVGLPSDDGSSRRDRGLQEERVERDAWKGILAALTRLKAAQDAKRDSDAVNTKNQDMMQD